MTQSTFSPLEPWRAQMQQRALAGTSSTAMYWQQYRCTTEYWGALLLAVDISALYEPWSHELAARDQVY